ncbi:hypothetical protein PMAYCL1PPCAC_26527, partial [Pristionchus mayeri]
IRRKENPRMDYLYRLSTSELLSSLIDGKEGELISEMPAIYRTLILAHKGLVITLERLVEEGVLRDAYFMRNISSSTKIGQRCNIQEIDERNRKTRRLIAVFD